MMKTREEIEKAIDIVSELLDIKIDEVHEKSKGMNTAKERVFNGLDAREYYEAKEIVDELKEEFIT